MATSQILLIHTEDDSFHVFLNGRNEIYIGDDSELINTRYVTIPIEDWEDVKTYIDNLIKQNKEWQGQ
jgi:hypothetical protein